MPEQKPQLDKFAIAAALQEIAQLMDLRGGKDRFKAKAYNAGARSIQAVTNLDKLIRDDQLTTLPRIGGALASQIKQLYLTGESSVLNDLRAEFPPGIVQLSTVPGLSLAKVRQLHEELGISSVAELKAAAEAGKLRDLKGFGAKTEQRLLEQISKPKEKPRQRLYLHHAWNTAEQIVEFMKTNRGLIEISVAGSLRRWVETVGTIEIVASSKKPAALVEHFLRLPLILSSEMNGENSCVAQLADSAVVAFTAVSPEEFPVVLFSRTGSEAHVDKVTKLITEVVPGIAGVSPATHGGVRLVARQARRLRSQQNRMPRSEAELYERAAMQYVPPELREDQGEIEAAVAGELPEDLLTLDDIKGMVHCHTTYSDGKHTLEQMVGAAEAMGMKYITITDHSPTAFYAGGLKVEDLYRQWDEIDEVQSKTKKIKILRGTESDILADGGLDYPERILEQMDCIVASVHARYKMDSRKMTERIVNAMQQPVFKIWGHALGRLLQRRPPFECDVERILDVIAESKAAIEINGDPYRLDLEPRWVREARKRKIRFVISVDAHSMGALANVKYGVAMARRGWVTRKEVLNALPLAQFRKAVHP